MFGVNYSFIDFDHNYNFKIKKIYKLINKNTAIIFLPIPNMPIEGNIDYMEVIKLIRYCQKLKIIILIDEVYYPFGKKSFINQIRKYDNLLVARSFSKAFGLAGIRLGFILGNLKHIKYISNSRSGYETNVLTAETAIFYIEHYSETLKYIKLVKAGIKVIKSKLNSLKIDYHGGTESNFIFINVKSSKKNNFIISYLKSKKFYVRGGWKKPWSKGFVISCSSPIIMKNFLKHFEVSLKKYHEN